MEENGNALKKIAFIGSECYPFVKTGGLGDVMYALPRALIREGCSVRVILPLYQCIPERYRKTLTFKGSFMMDLTQDGKTWFVGIMETELDGVIYDFVENREFFDWGNPYTGLWEDIPKYCFFSKASLAVLNYLEWTPDIIHCHDWQAALVPMYLKTKFYDTLGSARSVLTIHNLRFQGICSIQHLKYWSSLDNELFDYPVLKQNEGEANMFKGGLALTDRITTVSATYAQEIQTPSYGEGLDAHLRYHQGKLSGIVNGIDVDQWNPVTDQLLPAPYSAADAYEKKAQNKRALQEALGLDVDESKMVLGLISRLTDQKGLDLVDAIVPRAVEDERTQIVVLGTGDPRYENAFRYYEREYPGTVCAYISYNEGLAHQIYAGADALLVPSLFEPCGLTQLIAMRYGMIPIVRATGGLKDTVLAYEPATNEGNGFTFVNYNPGELIGAVDRAKELYFGDRWRWDEMSRRDMEKDVSWESSARQYMDLYCRLR